jgi:hypothetical protein
METCHDCEARFEVVEPLNVRCALCQCKLDDGAIRATLKECGGEAPYLSLPALIADFKAYKSFYEKQHGQD